jgi:hypothetical protein
MHFHMLTRADLNNQESFSETAEGAKVAKIAFITLIYFFIIYIVFYRVQLGPDGGIVL